jgi:DNA-binding transcriptional MerR regulator
MLKISELAARSGVSVGTIKHYLREGLLGSDEQVVRTSRNMAYYPVEYVDRVRLIKRLQEERFMPLRVIRELIADATGRMSRAKVRETYAIPSSVLARLEELGVLTPTARGYDADDVSIIAAMHSKLLRSHVGVNGN